MVATVYTFAVELPHVVFSVAQCISNRRLNWLIVILRISNWVNCFGPHCVRIGDELREYPSFVASVVCCHLRCKLSFL